MKHTPFYNPYYKKVRNPQVGKKIKVNVSERKRGSKTVVGHDSEGTSADSGDLDFRRWFHLNLIEGLGWVCAWDKNIH